MIEKINALMDDDRGVSPVIGVILMVAITVILAAVIGTFVLGLGDSLDQTPQAQLSLELNETETGDNILKITHNGGDQLDESDLRVTAGSEDVDGLFGDGQFRVGEERELSDDDDDFDRGVTVRIIHEPSDSFILDRTL